MTLMDLFPPSQLFEHSSDFQAHHGYLIWESNGWIPGKCGKVAHSS